MSGPITPPLTVETVDGATEGRPITTIKVSNGDLTISGSTATISTGGSGAPGGSNTYVQYNDSGSFGGSSSFTYDGGEVTIGNACYINGDINSVASGSDWTLIARAATGGTIQGSISLGGGADEPIVLSAGEAGSTAHIQLIPGSGGGVVKVATTLEIGGNWELPTSAGTNNYVLTSDGAGSSSWSAVAGDVTATGTPTDNQLAVWDSASSIEGDSNLTWNGSLLAITGDVSIDGRLKVNTITSESTDTDISIAPDGTGEVKICEKWFLPTDVPSDNNYVLTAQTDGTTAWAAAAGGGGSPPTIATDMDATYDTIMLSALPPFSRNVLTSSSQTIDTSIYFVPFILGSDVTGVNLQVGVNSSTASTNLLLGIYNANSSTGSPTTLITNSTTTIDVSTTSYKTGTLAATQNLTANTLYYIGFCCDANSCGLRSHSTSGSTGITGLINGLDNYNKPLLFDSSTTASLPASVSASNLQTKYGVIPFIGMEI